LLERRPFRAPHHSTSGVGLAGGGTIPKPGEVSLAHHGVLFLDELPEFRRGALEVLRQPMEEGKVVITRSMQTMEFPASFILVAAMNPCPCGHLGSPGRDCACTPWQVAAYRGRVSGPLLDRFDIHLEVPRARAEDLGGSGAGEPSAAVRKRVLTARAIQRKRLEGYASGMDDTHRREIVEVGLAFEQVRTSLRRSGASGYHEQRSARTNAQMTAAQIREHCVLDAEGRRLLHSAVDRLGLSARAYHRILKVARTLADLEGEEGIAPRHVGEGIQYRLLDRSRGDR
jgi:magnesium chelatase family protein